MQSLPQNLPVGWRFQPTNEELLDHYLKSKRLGLPIHGSDIDEVQICDFDPWDLIDRNSTSKERYLFCRPQFHKKTGGIQRNRKGKSGQWKRTGEIQFITREDGDEVIGTKTIFVYHAPKPTEFVKHELELSSSVQDDYDFVLCKLMISKKKKAIRKRKIVGLLHGKEGTTNPKEEQVDCNKNKPNKKARKGLSDCEKEIVGDSAHGGAEPTNHLTPEFKYQSSGYSRTNSACVEGQWVNHLTLDFDNQTPIMMSPTSNGENGESSHQGNEYERNNSSIYDKDTTMFLMDYDLGNQNPQEIGDVSRYSMSTTSSHMVTDLENQIPNDKNAISLHDISSSLSGNQNPCEITAASTHKTVETSSLTNFDFGNSNRNERIADFSCKESERSLPLETPLDQYGKNEISETEYHLLDSRIIDTDSEEEESSCRRRDTSNLEDLGVEATFPQENSEKPDELIGLDDLLDSFR